MSLEAIAALLGHRSMRMTLIYARIADRTVANEYYAVTEQVEALYDATPVLPASAEGRQMRQLRVETYQRLLGNGYCTRPPELDCVFESICETCTHYQTGLEFQPVLLRQRDHAVEHDQPQRAELFNKLLDDIDNELTRPPATTLHDQEQPDGRPIRDESGRGGRWPGRPLWAAQFVGQIESNVRGRRARVVPRTT